MLEQPKNYNDFTKEELIIELLHSLTKNKQLISALKEIRDNTASQMEWEVASEALKNHKS